jgi:NAD(P)-dependent dehydrogenase (short-subunit alcohol dehydrogenase family)
VSRHPVAGSVVVVTGAARGIGAELARVLTGRGARVALLGLEPVELAAVSARLPGSASYEVDVTDEAALAEVARQVLAHFGRVDVVVANAGIGEAGTLLTSEAAAYDRVIEVNLLGSVRTVRAFLPALVASRGYVLQVASLAALVPAPLMSAYCASKSGVEAFAHALRGEVRHHGVDVGVAYLSWTDTDMVRNADAKAGVGQDRSRLPWVFGKTYPLGPAVARLADGVEGRRAHVYGQGWVRLVQGVRGALPLLMALGSRSVAEVEAGLLSAGRPSA